MSSNWKITDKRFIAFFDIMGFKDFVERNSHQKVVEKLQKLKENISKIENLHHSSYVSEFYKISESKVVTFSDSIIIFSKDDSKESLTKILIDASIFIWAALKNEVPVKGALSYGEITADFDASLFFGRPIIDAFLLHEQLQLYTAVLDHHIESRIRKLHLYEKLHHFIVDYKAPLKTGKITHTLIRQPQVNIEEQIRSLKKLSNGVSGAARIYIDHTLDFLQAIRIK